MCFVQFHFLIHNFTKKHVLYVNSLEIKCIIYTHPRCVLSDSEELSSWVDSVLRSHEPTVVQDLSASLELTAPTTTGSISTLAVRDDNRVKGIKAEGDKRGSGTKEGITMVWDSVASGDHAGRGSFNRGGSGAVLVHGPAGVGKTCLVRGKK